MTDIATRSHRWVSVLDSDLCVGCHACTVACKSEHAVPLGVTRTFVKSAEVGSFPQVKRVFQVLRCNQCGQGPCVDICPTGAMYRRPDGIVDVDKKLCIGCEACMAACPYDAIFINPADHSAEKCNLCAHRLDNGLQPACVAACPAGAIRVGDLADPSSGAVQAIRGGGVTPRAPEKRTQPGVFYQSAHPATLDPLAARHPDGGLFACATAGPAGRPRGLGRRWQALRARSARPARAGGAPDTLLCYDVPRRVPWGWRVSLSTWAKGVAVGAFAILLPLLLTGALKWDDSLARWALPTLALGFLAVTGALMLADLKHPERCYLMFTRRRWGSWLVRGSFCLLGYGAALAAFLTGSLVGSVPIRQIAAGVAVPLGIAVAVYTAYLFAQATGRDLWNDVFLRPHLLVQALLAGAAAALPGAVWLGPRRAVTAAAAWLCAGAVAHLLVLAIELTRRRHSPGSRLAVAELTRGASAWFFWPGLVLTALAVAAPLAADPVAVALALAALAGLAAHDHAYIQAAQSVPLA